MELVRITETTDPLYEEALRLYEISFPPYEQRRACSQAAILGDEAYHFDCIMVDGAFAGVILYWVGAQYLYVEHFCIKPHMRSHGYGRQALECLMERGKTLILEIDPPVDALSERRKGFYERCGFVANPYTHIHPPYHCENHGHELVIMSHPAAISRAEYDAFAEDLRTRVMAGALD